MQVVRGGVCAHARRLVRGRVEFKVESKDKVGGTSSKAHGREGNSFEGRRAGGRENIYIGSPDQGRRGAGEDRGNSAHCAM